MSLNQSTKNPLKSLNLLGSFNQRGKLESKITCYNAILKK